MGWQLIQSQSLSASAASVTFSNIPQTYKSLMVQISSRSTWSDVGIDLLMRFNGDTGSNYTTRRLTGNGTSAGSDTSAGTVATPGVISANNGTINTFSSITITIPNYSGNANKAWSSDAIQENNTTAATQRLNAGLWSSATAISSILLYSNGSGAELVFGSTFTLYGLA